MISSIEDRMAGCLVGGAIGDAMGLPFEGCKGPLKYVPPDSWRVSDDTELTVATCEAIAKDGRVSPESIAQELCTWFREGRIHGMGASTLKSLRELDEGGHWALVGRRGELAAGNGAAMRVAPLGFMLDPSRHDARVLLRDVCRITHHNDEAYIGALAVVAPVHHLAFRQSTLKPALLDVVHKLLPDSNVRDRILRLREFVDGKSIWDCAARFGSSGYVVDSVPLALAAVTYVPTLGFQGVLEAVIECGGDTDTIASIVGQIAGTALGVGGLPSVLVQQLTNHNEIRQVASRLYAQTKRPYSRAELLTIADDAWPSRGDYCEKCGSWIPQFADITDEDVARLRSLSNVQAMKEIKERTGCSLKWAKIWALHPNGPQPRFAGPPCPFCGEPLRTEKAKQCLNCGADWHNQIERGGV